MSKARSRMYILRVCKYYSFSKKDLDLLFYSLIVSALVFGTEVWGCASYNKYLIQIDKLFQRAFKYGHSIQKLYRVSKKKLMPFQIQISREFHCGTLSIPIGIQRTDRD